VERRGAPVEAYLRLDSKPILIRTNVYTPDHVVVLDASLLHSIDVTQGLKPGGWILLNTSGLPADYTRFSAFRTACVDATAVALRHGLGSRTHPIVNTAIMGAFARMMGAPSMDAVAKAIEEEVPAQPEQNIAAAVHAYEEVRLPEDARVGSQ
jgi:pyruvate ferredoxin oxidoreductase gamma subunit/2-oxoisovalerate ferredoxin oxidoreductase gamma subunit